MKNCPFCAEEIKDAAIKCRYCKSDLPKFTPQDDEKEVKQSIGNSFIIGSFLFFVAILTSYYALVINSNIAKLLACIAASVFGLGIGARFYIPLIKQEGGKVDKIIVRISYAYYFIVLILVSFFGYLGIHGLISDFTGLKFILILICPFVLMGFVAATVVEKLGIK